jgi:membrane protease YdiL (CAAX protease family)
MIGALIWTVSLYLIAGASDVFSKYGIDILVDSGDMGKTIFGKVITAVYTCILAPITEELFFRGMLLKTFSKANQRFAIFASAVFFGLIHGNIQQFILATLLGVFLAHITLKHGSIIPSVIVHAFVNSSASLVGFLARQGNTASVLTYLALIGAALVGVIMLLVFNSNDKIPSTTPAQSRRGLAVAAGSLPFMGALTIYIAEVTLSILSKK